MSKREQGKVFPLSVVSTGTDSPTEQSGGMKRDMTQSAFSKGTDQHHSLRYLLRDALARLFAPLTLAMWIGSSALTAIAGPFGTYRTFSFLHHFGIWLVFIGVCICAAYFTNACVRYLTGMASGPKFYLVFLPIASLAGGAAVDVLLAYWLGGTSSSQPSFWLVSLYVFAVMGAILGVRILLGFGDSAGTETSVPDIQNEVEAIPKQAPSRLAQRLGLEPGAHIHRISANGHHIDVHTCTEVRRIRMRFSDAILELDGLEGLTTHRSHWVLLSAIEGWHPARQKPVVVLTNGETIPVSKTYRRDVEAAGLEVLTNMSESA